MDQQTKPTEAEMRAAISRQFQLVAGKLLSQLGSLILSQETAPYDQAQETGYGWHGMDSHGGHQETTADS